MRTAILNLAASYIGTHEEPPGSNNVIFNTDYYGRPVSGSQYPWCCAFVWDIFRMANMSRLFYDGQRTAYCPTVLSWAIGEDILVPFEEAKPADLVLFDWDGDSVPDHIGFVERLEGNQLVTIEGNTSDADYSNGGYVLRRYRHQSTVQAIVQIQYPEENIMFTVNQIQKGDHGNDVFLMQSILRGRGYIDRQTRRLPAVDGSFGDETERCLIYYQAKNNLEVDGVCGPATWRSLLRR